MDLIPDVSEFLLRIWDSTLDVLIGMVLLALMKPFWRFLNAEILPHAGRWLESVLRGSRRRKLMKIRRWRYDLAWIQRETSRSHTCFAMCITCTLLWMLASGLKEVVFSDQPLLLKPSTALFLSSPMLLFELAWLWFSSSAATVIQYRQKAKTWRHKLARRGIS